MNYSAGMVSKPFWYIETKKTAKYLLEGFDKDSIKNLTITENIYQTSKQYRAIEIFNMVYKRLNSLDKVLERIKVLEMKSGITFLITHRRMKCTSEIILNI